MHRIIFEQHHHASVTKDSKLVDNSCFRGDTMLVRLFLKPNLGRTELAYNKYRSQRLSEMFLCGRLREFPSLTASWQRAPPEPGHLGLEPPGRKLRLNQVTQGLNLQDVDAWKSRELSLHSCRRELLRVCSEDLQRLLNTLTACRFPAFSS